MTKTTCFKYRAAIAVLILIMLNTIACVHTYATDLSEVAINSTIDNANQYKEIIESLKSTYKIGKKYDQNGNNKLPPIESLYNETANSDASPFPKSSIPLEEFVSCAPIYGRHSFFWDYSYYPSYLQWKLESSISLIPVTAVESNGDSINCKIYRITTDTGYGEAGLENFELYLEIGDSKPVYMSKIFEMGYGCIYESPFITKQTINQIYQTARNIKGSELVFAESESEGDMGDYIEYFVSDNSTYRLMMVNDVIAIAYGEQGLLANMSGGTYYDIYTNENEDTDVCKSILTDYNIDNEFPPFLKSKISYNTSLYCTGLPDENNESEYLNETACKLLLKGVVFDVIVNKATISGYRKIQDNYLVFYNVYDGDITDETVKQNKLKYAAIYNSDGILQDALLLPTNLTINKNMIVGNVPLSDIIQSIGDYEATKEYEYIILSDRFFLKKAHWNVTRARNGNEWDINPYDFLKYIPLKSTDYDAWLNVMQDSTGEYAEDHCSYGCILSIRGGESFKKWYNKCCPDDSRYMFYINIDSYDSITLPDYSEWYWKFDSSINY